MQYLKADTVTEVLIGPVVAVADGFTPVTTLTIAGADEAEIIKHGATTVTAITGTLAAITGADGYYALDLVVGDVDTEGRLTILINDDSLCLPVRHDFMVVNANVFDSLFAAAATDYLQVDTTQWIGTACATPTTAGVPEVDVTHVAGTAQTAGDLAALITAVDDFVDTEVAAIKSDTAAILVDTAEIGAAGAGLTAIAVGVGGIQAASFAAGAIDAAALAADATTELTAGIRIKKNTALSNFPFLMVDSTDHITPKTGLTITATRSIDGAAFAACANAAAEVANGFYKINLANTDLNGDTIAFKFTGGATADDRLLTIITTV